MKLLKYTLFRSCPHEEGGPVGELCHFCVFNSSMLYAAILGTLGLILSLYDLKKIITYGNILPCNILKTGIATVLELLKPEVTRDFTLMGNVVSSQCYALLVLGSIRRNQMFFIPWMTYYSLIITLEFASFLVGVFRKGVVFNKHSLIISIFIVYNWLTIFCAYHRIGDERRTK